MTQGLRISIADDEPDMRDFLVRMLPRCGHEVVSAASTGQQLIVHCQQFQPDLVITDIKMPGLDGIEASSLIYRDRPVPVILVSAYHDQALIERAQADHVIAYLVKPITVADLQPAISIAMRRFTEWQSLHRECDDLIGALANRKVIEQAKSILMKIACVSENEAFERLQTLASEANLKLVEAAEEVIAMENTFSRKIC
jgi:response regulator NasT